MKGEGRRAAGVPRVRRVARVVKAPRVLMVWRVLEEAEHRKGRAAEDGAEGAAAPMVGTKHQNFFSHAGRKTLTYIVDRKKCCGSTVSPS